jgi:hypothetical protein
MLRPQIDPMQPPFMTHLSVASRRRFAAARCGLPSRSIAIVSGLIAIVLLACAQGEGEPCQINRDCDDGLVCVFAAGSERSVCRSPNDIEDDAGTPDAGDPVLPEDEDAGQEPAPEEDAGGESEEDAGG